MQLGVGISENVPSCLQLLQGRYAKVYCHFNLHCVWLRCRWFALSCLKIHLRSWQYLVPVTNSNFVVFTPLFVLDGQVVWGIMFLGVFVPAARTDTNIP